MTAVVGRLRREGSQVVAEFDAPANASRCRGCGASGPVGIEDVDACPWCDGTPLPASAVRVVRLVPSKAARRISRGRR